MTNQQRKEKTTNQIVEAFGENVQNRMYLNDNNWTHSEIKEVQEWLRKELEARDREVGEAIGKLKRWIFTAPYVFEICECGEAIPRERKDSAYIKESDILSLLHPHEEKPKCEYCENGEEHKAGAIYPCTPHEEKGCCEKCRGELRVSYSTNKYSPPMVGGFMPCRSAYTCECNTKDLIE